MKYWYQQPRPELAAYVRTMLVIEGFAESDSNTLPMLTNGMSALFCRTEKNSADHESILKLTLLGTAIPPGYWLLDTQTTIIAYFFKPFTLPSFFNIKAKSLKESEIDLRILNPRQFNALKSLVNDRTSTSQKIEVLDNLLVTQLKQNAHNCELIQYATNQIMNDSGLEVIPKIIQELKLNERTFQRTFKKFVGITPTQYRRICQFQLSFGQLKSKKFDKLSDIAYENGFADQSHFIRSFKEFTQITPKNYLQKGLSNKI
ncbi:MAG: AraC family transcriptional regulator [Chitinophagaceae bacterium]|nr:MAG: AraC family transcriptional regulator [Chitinophagaceae bacterium]